MAKFKITFPKEMPLWLLLLVMLAIMPPTIYVIWLNRTDPRYQVDFVYDVMRESYIYIARYRYEYGEFPDELPDKISPVEWMKDGILILADPFNHNENEKLYKVKVVRNDVTWDDLYPVNFKFKGGKISYRKVSADVALLYSYGPDMDDDISNISNETILENINKDINNWDDFNNRFQYNSANGEKSNGDIVWFLVWDYEEDLTARW